MPDELLDAADALLQAAEEQIAQTTDDAIAVASLVETTLRAQAFKRAHPGVRRPELATAWIHQLSACIGRVRLGTAKSSDFTPIYADMRARLRASRGV